MGGAVGLDMAAVMEMGRAQGFDAAALAILLPYGEAGLVTALNSKEDDPAAD